VPGGPYDDAGADVPGGPYDDAGADEPGGPYDDDGGPGGIKFDVGCALLKPDCG